MFKMVYLQAAIGPTAYDYARRMNNDSDDETLEENLGMKVLILLLIMMILIKNSQWYILDL